MNLIVGCPIYQRAWIFEKWYERVVAEARAADLDHLSFVFVIDEGDDETVESIEKVMEFPGAFLTCKEEHKDKGHNWEAADFPRMSTLRNTMLEFVRSEEPNYFLSLDSDLLLEENAISAMLHGVELGYDAVGIVTSMCRQVWCESWMYYAPTAHGFVRPGQRVDANEHFPVDAIMAGKLMTPKAYSIDYKHDPQGEDLGWNRNCHDADVRRGIHGSARARHVMFKDDLEKSPVNFW
jgi:hypothetical protein